MCAVSDGNHYQSRSIRENLFRALPSSAVALSSGPSMHIPLIDFHCPFGRENEELSACASKLLDPKGGYLLSSGQSYHFYGKSLLNEDELPAFLGRALLLSPIVDRSWVAHQLIEGACGLRISARLPNGDVPRLVREV